ncbi:hypothetical protein RZS08_03505, partial [Arthrospira platensis SPKY1]|nr:hypothetical protein [Arthrospira platensis SPKY1]
APRHLIYPDLYLGSSVDGEEDGQPEAMAGMMENGDDGNTGTPVIGVQETEGDDEDGIRLASPMIPGYPAMIVVDAVNNTEESAVLQAWIDFNGNGQFDQGEELT